MKKVLVAGITAAVFCGAPVFAADMPVKAPPMAAPVFNWSGWYAGINGGYAWSDNGDITYRDPGGTGATIKGFDSNGGFGGGQLGFNVQSGQLVWGLETDIQGSDIRKTFGPIIVTNNNTGTDTDSGSQRINYFGTIRGRIGLAADRTLVYATGGFAYGEVKETVNVNRFVGSSSGTQTGWVAGGGIEHSFAPNWSVKLEYQYIDLGSKTLIDPASVITSRNVDGRFSTVRVGLNYKFGGDPWGKAPVVAKY